MVREVENLEEFNKILKESGSKLIVVDFTATWCGPCKMIAPFYHSLSEKYPDVIFLKVDVDDAQDVASHCGIKCMPTFHFYRNEKLEKEFSGANKEGLEKTLKELAEN
ncbi:thioredoxin-like [Pelodytes ibericus]